MRRLSLGSIVQALMPPLLFETIVRFKKRPQPQPSPFGYEPKETFAAAAADAGLGYSDERLLAPFHDTRAYLEDGVADFAATLFASVAAASIKTSGATIRVLDFGGASGYQRSYVRTFFQDSISTDWTIVETAAQVSFVGDLGKSNVRYSSDIGTDPFDLAIFSGSLQYVEDWKRALASVNADMVYIARTPLGDVEKCFLQRGLRDGAPVKYPGRVIARDELFSVLEPTHRLHCLWKLDAHLLEMGLHEAPAMLWDRHPR